MTTIPDEVLMAFADGELDAAEAAAVARAAAADPEVAARIELFRASRQAVSAALGGRPAPVPEALAERIRTLAAASAGASAGASADARSGAGQPGSARVVSLSGRRARSGAPAAPVWQLPLAAALALALGAAGGFLAAGRGTGPGPAADPVVAALAGPAVAEALATLPSGEGRALPDGGRVRAVASFRDAGGALCREVELEGADRSVVAVSCAGDGGWSLRFAVAAAPGGDGYAPASSLEALDAFLAATGAGAPLSPEDEAAALADLR